MLKKKLKEIEVFNSSIPQDKYKRYNCFYCKQKGHIIKACPIKIKDEAEHVQNCSVKTTEGNKEAINPTHSKFTLDKSMILCFRSKEYGHFANRCPPKKQEQPKVSINVIAEILGLTRDDGEEIKKCYMTYLDIFTSYSKTARAPWVFTKVEEDSESLMSYQWNIGKTCAPVDVQKGNEKQEHFGIKLEDEEDCKNQQSTYYAKEQDKNKVYTRPSTSRISDKEGSYESTSDDYFNII
nr:ARID DNA-binding domain-containing protein [Tanacetum cinerariifolium]